jgi:hypothetical protein
MRLVILAFAVVTVVATAAAQPGRVPLTPDEAQFVRNHPPVRMMVDPHFEPADFVDDTGAHAGMAADFLKLLSDRTGLTFVPVPLTPAQRANLDPDARGIDGVALSAATPDRAKFYTFTDTLLEFPAYILTRRSVDHFLTPTDLIGLGLSVVLGVAQDAGGYVDLQTEMGQGTTFEVFWPAVG